MQCILHIGFGKTGSSALQGYLSGNPILGSPPRYRYVVIDRDGSVLDGERIPARVAAADAPTPYLASAPRLGKRGDLDAIARRLADAPPTESTLILSQEAWARCGAEWREADVLNRLGLRAQVVGWVRPQIEWFNSGWWQWWAWIDGVDTPADLLRKWRPSFMWWWTWLQPWAKNPHVDAVKVRLYQRDTVSDFLSLLGVRPPAPVPATVVNRSLAPLHLRLRKSAPYLQSWKRGAEIDWALQELLPSNEPPPWALAPDDMQAIVDGCRADNERLLAALPPDQADRMRADPRWWSTAPYLDRRPVSAADLVATRADLLRAAGALTRAGIRAMLQADARKRFMSAVDLLLEARRRGRR